MNNIKSKNPFVSIIIPVYKDWEKLEFCLEALKNQSYPINNFEIIVVDNEGIDKIPDFIEHFENIRVLQETIPGSYAARNTGIKKAKGEIIGFTDADCIPDQDWIKNAVKKLTINYTIDRLAGSIKLIFKNHKKKNMIELYEHVFAFNQEGAMDSSGASITANTFVRKPLFQKVGYFNENMKSGGDIEWGKRAHNKGSKILYAPEAVVYHPARDSWHSIIHKKMRVLGGHEFMNLHSRSSGLKKRWFSTIKKVIETKKLKTLVQRVKVILVMLVLKLVIYFERIRLSLGGKSLR